jgi:tetratricopeptide (TPR) repeat protein
MRPIASAMHNAGRMDNTRIDAQALTRAGIDALKRGDRRKARDAFAAIVAAGVDDATTCIGLGAACRGLGDVKAGLAAVDRALSHDPDDFRALILKADLLGDAGDSQAALSFHLAAIKVAAPVEDQLPPELRRELARARAKCDQFATRSEEFLRSRLADAGLAEGQSSARFQQSLDILFGRKQPYFQQPRYYFFPGLPQTQFYDRADFPWLDRVEAATAGIREELVEIMREQSAFKPYVQGDPKRPRKLQDGMLDNADWSAFYLWKNGEVVAENAARCPRTLAALEGAPVTRMPGRSPSILFSQLRPGARIPPHCGLVNTRLICHLPLIVPEGCSFRVGNDTRPWEEGKAWVFDDTIEHEAWNRSDRTRVILLFEIWRPELTAEERILVSAMIEAIDAFGGSMPAWEI